MIAIVFTEPLGFTIDAAVIDAAVVDAAVIDRGIERYEVRVG